MQAVSFKGCFSLFLSIVLVLPAFAADKAKKEEKPQVWDGSIQAGGVGNTGNTDSINVNGKVVVKYEKKAWRANAEVEGELNTSNSNTTAARIATKVEGRYLVDPKNYMFGRIEMVADRFATYDLNFIDAMGYGRVLLNNKKNNLTLELGPGSRQSRISGKKTYQVEFIINVDAVYQRKISETTLFTQRADLDVGHINTHTKLISAVKTKMSKNLALEVSYTVENDTKIPAGSKNTKHTDTITKIAVVYDF